MNTYLYEYGGKLYINLTNQCSNACVFCIRNSSDGVGGNKLWLSETPSYSQVIELLKARRLDDYEEFVFCGFGEPLYAFESVVKIGEFLRGLGKKVRLNTNGQASLIVGANAAARLKDAVDTVNISLNASSAARYNAVCRCAFGEAGFYSMLEFAGECVSALNRVVLSVVDTVGKEEIRRCAEIAQGIGAEFRVRAYDS